MSGTASGMTPDQAEWLVVARSVMAGRYDGLRRGSSVRDAIEIGLGSIAHPTCVSAMHRLARADAPKVKARAMPEDDLKCE